MNTNNPRWLKWVRRMSGLTTAIMLMLSMSGQASARILFEDDDYFNIQSEGIILDYNNNVQALTAAAATSEGGTYTAATPGAAGNAIDIVIVDGAACDIAAADCTTVLGSVITITVALNDANADTITGDNVTSAMIVAEINSDAQASALVTASAGDGTAVTAGTINLAGGADAGNIDIQIGNDGTDAMIRYNDATQDVTLSTPGGDFDFSNDNITTTGGAMFSGSSEFHIREVAGNPNTVAACSAVDEVVLDTTANKVYVCTATGAATVATWATPDADTLSGLTSSQFLRSDTSDSYTSGTLTFNAGTILDVNGAIDFSGATSFLLYQGGVNPGTCTEGEIFYNTGDNTTYICTAANTWTGLSSGNPDFESVYAADGDSTLTTSNGDFTVAAGTGAINLDSTNAAGISLNDSINGPVNIGTGTSTGTVTIGGTGAQTIAIGDGAGAKTVNIGSSNTTSTTTLLSGSGGLNFNVNNNQATNINTGTSTGTVTIGGGSNDVTVNGKVVGITSTGAGNDITLTSADDIIFDDAQLTGIVQLTGTATDWAATFSSDGIVDNINSFTSTANGEGASNVGIEDAGLYFTGTDVEAALQELGLDASKRVEDLTFYPEYPDTVVDADGTNNKGTLESLYDAVEESGYYNWTTTNAVTQDIDLHFAFPLPTDFAATGNFTYRYRTGTVTTADNNVEIRLYNVTDATECANDLINGSAGVWATGTITAVSIDTGCTGATALNAGDIVEVRIKLLDNVGAPDYADAGKVVWNYTK